MVPENLKKSMIHLYPDLKGSNWDVPVETIPVFLLI